MIRARNFLFYSADADADRAFVRDVLELRAVDAGHGWLIFALPPSEAAFHPADRAFVQDQGGESLLGAVLYLMCDDLDATTASLESRHVVFTPVQVAPWGAVPRCGCQAARRSGSTSRPIPRRSASPEPPSRFTSEVIDRGRTTRHHASRAAARVFRRGPGAIVDSINRRSFMSFQNPSLLRGALVVDAVVSGVTGLLLMAGAAWLESLLAVPQGLLRYAGLSLLPFAAMVALVATREPLSRAAVGTVVALNFGWVVASVLLLLVGGIEPNGLGVAFILVQAVAVAVLADVQFMGIRKGLASA